MKRYPKGRARRCGVDRLGLLTNWSFDRSIRVLMNRVLGCVNILYMNSQVIEFGLMGLVPHSKKPKKPIIYKFCLIYLSRLSDNVLLYGHNFF